MLYHGVPSVLIISVSIMSEETYTVLDLLSSNVQIVIGISTYSCLCYVCHAFCLGMLTTKAHATSARGSAAISWLWVPGNKYNTLYNYFWVAFRDSHIS